MKSVTAKSLILDLLRASKPQALPVRVLVATAAIFDISENALRVNLNRLIKRDVISTDSRGYYQVSAATSPLRNWVSTWRDGEQRMRPWQQEWLNLQISSEMRNKASEQLQRAAYRFGFRPLWDNSWVRPDNLAMSTTDLRQLLTQLSDQEDFMLCIVSRFDSTSDLTRLWPLAGLEEGYQRHINALNESIAHIKTVDTAQRFRESFVLGGNCIHTLAIDPLLPEPMITGQLRDQLTQLMQTYDTLCRPFWQDLFSQYDFLNSPAHLEPQLNQLLAIR